MNVSFSTCCDCSLNSRLEDDSFPTKKHSKTWLVTRILTIKGTPKFSQCSRCCAISHAPTTQFVHSRASIWKAWVGSSDAQDPSKKQYLFDTRRNNIQKTLFVYRDLGHQGTPKALPTLALPSNFAYSTLPSRAPNRLFCIPADVGEIVLELPQNIHIDIYI